MAHNDVSRNTPIQHVERRKRPDGTVVITFVCAGMLYEAHPVAPWSSCPSLRMNNEDIPDWRRIHLCLLKSTKEEACRERIMEYFIIWWLPRAIRQRPRGELVAEWAFGEYMHQNVDSCHPDTRRWGELQVQFVEAWQQAVNHLKRHNLGHFIVRQSS